MAGKYSEAARQAAESAESSEPGAETSTQAEATAVEETQEQREAPKVDELISDMDLSDFTPQQIEKITKKARDLQRIGTKKSQEAAEKIKQAERYIKLDEELSRDPNLKKAVESAIQEYRSGGQKSKMTAEEKRQMNKLDEWIEDAPDKETRDRLKEFKGAILELSNADKVTQLESKIDELNRTISELSGDARMRRSESISKQIDGLEKKYASSLVDKHREQLENLMSDSRFSKYSAEQILFKIAEPEDLLDARLNGSKPSEARPSGGVTPSEPELKEDWKTGRGKTKTWDWGKAIRGIHQRNG